MLVQGFLVAVLLGVTVGIDLFYTVGHLLRQQAVPGASTGFAFVSFSILQGSVYVVCICTNIRITLFMNFKLMMMFAFLLYLREFLRSTPVLLRVYLCVEAHFDFRSKWMPLLC